VLIAGYDAGSRKQEAGSRVQSAECRVQGAGCRVQRAESVEKLKTEIREEG
jgi:hypothetical protein